LALRNIVGNRPCQKRVIGIGRGRVQEPKTRAVPCRPVVEGVRGQTRLHILSLAHGQRGREKTLLGRAPNQREAVRLSRAFKPAHERRGVATVVKTLKGIRRRDDPAGRRKSLKDAQPVFVEVLRFIHQDQRKTPGHPFLNGFVFQKTRRQGARPVKFAQCVGLCLHRGRNQAPAPRGHSPGEHIERLAIEAPAERRVLAKASIQAAARTVHEGKRQELVPFAQNPILNDLSRAAHEIVGLSRAGRALEKIECHGGDTKRKTCISAVESAATRVKSGVLAFAGSRSTAHIALSNCAARVRQGALAIIVMATLSWVGA
jgi:hypothetical protein